MSDVSSSLDSGFMGAALLARLEPPSPVPSYRQVLKVRKRLLRQFRRHSTRQNNKSQASIDYVLRARRRRRDVNASRSIGSVDSKLEYDYSKLNLDNIAIDSAGRLRAYQDTGILLYPRTQASQPSGTKLTELVMAPAQREYWEKYVNRVIKGRSPPPTPEGASTASITRHCSFRTLDMSVPVQPRSVILNLSNVPTFALIAAHKLIREESPPTPPIGPSYQTFTNSSRGKKIVNTARNSLRLEAALSK
jgi:hypothetical protein